jgi:tRNA1Val (adenine37-N6)-methyltransferase
VADVTEDRVLGGQVILRQPMRGYRAAMDALLLAAAIPVEPRQHLLDLCCGVGTVGLCVLQRQRDLQVTGVEIAPELAALASQNAELNSLGRRYTVITGNLRSRDLVLPDADHVALNPPWFDNAHPASPDPLKAGANSAEPGFLEDVIDLAIRRTRSGGTLTLIHRTEALPSILRAFDDRLGAISVLPIETIAGEAPPRLLIRAIKGRKTAFRLLPALKRADIARLLAAPLPLAPMA